MLFLGAEAHHVLDACAVVPTAIEDHDFAGRREVLHLALKIHLALFAIGWRGKATMRNTRGLTRSVMARMVPPFPAASRPSKTTITRRPLYLTQSCSLASSA